MWSPPSYFSWMLSSMTTCQLHHEEGQGTAEDCAAPSHPSARLQILLQLLCVPTELEEVNNSYPNRVFLMNISEHEDFPNILQGNELFSYTQESSLLVCCQLTFFVDFITCHIPPWWQNPLLFVFAPTSPPLLLFRSELFICLVCWFWNSILWETEKDKTLQSWEFSFVTLICPPFPWLFLSTPSWLWLELLTVPFHHSW